jgi:hypothetical protein
MYNYDMFIVGVMLTVDKGGLAIVRKRSYASHSYILELMCAASESTELSGDAFSTKSLAATSRRRHGGGASARGQRPCPSTASQRGNMGARGAPDGVSRSRWSIMARTRYSPARSAGTRTPIRVEVPPFVELDA